MYGKPGRVSLFDFSVGAARVLDARSTRYSKFQCPWLLRTRFKLGSVRLSREISKRPWTRDVSRNEAVTSSERNMGSALNAGSS